MEEARRFLRYVLPGVTFGLLAILELLILRPDLATIVLGYFGKDSGIGTAVLALLSTGGIGFLLSVIHHAIHWRQAATLIDHRKNVADMAADSLIPPTSTELSREDAWIATSVEWYSRREEAPVKGADQNARGLTDLAHMLGTARVAAWAAALTAFGSAAASSGLDLSTPGIVRFGIAAAIAAASIALLQQGYARAARFAQGVIDGVLRRAVHPKESADQRGLSAPAPHPALPAPGIPNPSLAGQAPVSVERERAKGQ